MDRAGQTSPSLRWLVWSHRLDEALNNPPQCSLTPGPPHAFKMWRGQRSQIDHNVCQLSRIPYKWITWTAQVLFETDAACDHCPVIILPQWVSISGARRRPRRSWSLSWQRKRTERSDVRLWLAIRPSWCLPTSFVIFRAVCLFVCQSQVLFRVRPNELKSPISHIKILEQ